MLVLGLIGVLLASGFYANHLAPVDSLHYYQTGQSDHLYGAVWGVGEGPDAWFVYPPPFAWFVRALSVAGWGVWLVAWTVILAVSFSVVRWVGVAVVIAGFAMRLVVDNFKPISEPANHLTIGNLQPLLLAAVVLGLRYPAGILWFAVRREWRSLAIAVATTAAIAAVSFLLSPTDWFEWIRFMTANLSTPSPVPVVPIPGWVRFPAAIALIVWGARTNRPWTLPIACGIASFALYEWSFLTIWLGVFAFVGPWARRDADGRLTCAPDVDPPAGSPATTVSRPAPAAEPA